MNTKPPRKGKPKRRPRDAGALREIRSGFYEGRASRVIDGERERERFYGSRQEVLDQMAAWRTSPKRKVRSTPITVRDHLTSWLVDVKASNRHATYALREGTVRRHIVPYLGELRLDQLERDQVQGWIDTLADAQIGARTRHLALVTLTCALNVAISDDLLSVNPCSKLKRRPRITKRSPYILSIEQANALLDAARQDPYHALYVLALRTGMRQGELFALEWANIDLDRATLRVEATLTEDEHGRLLRTEPKTKASRREVALSPAAVAALREHRRLTSGFQGLVFTSSTGTPVRKSGFIRRHFHPLLRRAGLPQITFHSLRHVSCSVLLANGASALETAERLGHTDTRMTLDTYGHVLGNAQRALAARLDAMFQPEIGPDRPSKHAQ